MTFDEWVKSLPAKHWAKYDLSACKVGWEARQANIEEQVKVLQQTLLEVSHAQQCGAEWYTKGEAGLFSQVSMWIRRGQTAIDEINK